MAKKKDSRVLITSFEVKVFEDGYEVSLTNPEKLTGRHIDTGLLNVINTLGEFQNKEVRALKAREAAEKEAAESTETQETEMVDG